jgi:hypothetical protein
MSSVGVVAVVEIAAAAVGVVDSGDFDVAADDVVVD